MGKRLGLACAMLAAPALAMSPVPAGAASAEPPDEQKFVCKQDAKAGSRFAKKICKSKAQWELLAEEHKRAAKDLVDRAKINTCKDGFNNCHTD